MFDDMEFNSERVPLYKLILHISQIVLSFVAWCLEIAVFRSKNASINGQSGWMFAVCFLSIPAWIYLIGAPRFPRTRRLAEPHAMVAVDVVYFIIWLSGFAAQAAYNSSGKCGNGCNISKAIVAMGVFNTIFFGITSFLSIYTLKYYQLNGTLPGYDRIVASKNPQNIDPDMAAFSTAPHGEEPYARLNDMDADYDHDDVHAARTEYTSDLGAYAADSHISSTGYGGASSVAGSSGYGGASTMYDQNTALSGHLGAGNPFDSTHSLRPAASATSLGTSVGHSSYMPPTVRDEYEDEHRPVRFPDADYDRQ